MNLNSILFFMIALSSVIIVGMVFHMSENGHKINMFMLSSDDTLYTNDNLERHEYTTERSTEMARTIKPFIYLTETEQCLPQNLATSSQIGDPATCDCDVIVLSFRSRCRKDNQPAHVSYLFDPNTGWASGRNLLFFAALDRRPGYHYYIFFNDDTFLRYNKFTPVDMRKMSPFRAVEEWLLDYEPAVGVLDYKFHNGADVVLTRRRELCSINKTSLVLPTVFFDAIFNAFHHKAIVHLLPYPTQYEYRSWLSIQIHTVTTIEVKFPGQALLFAPVTAGNPVHRPYESNQENRTQIWKEYVEQIIQEAPPQLRKHAVFEELRNQVLKRYLTKFSRTFCLNVTRHQPIIPYRHLLNE